MEKKDSKSLLILLILTIVTKALGFLKTTIVAAYFGSNIQTDIYNLADGIVNQIFYAFTISIAMLIVPMYLSKKEESIFISKRFAKSVYIAMIAFGVLWVVLILFLSPTIAKIIGREYDSSYIELLAQYMQVLSIGIMLTLVTNVIQGILNAERVYGFPSICAMFNSVIIILFAIFLSDYLGIWSIVIAVPIAYLLQTVFLRFKAHSYLNIRLNKNGGIDKDISALFLNIIPVFLSNATMELNGFIDKYILAGLEEGAVTAVSYAMVLLVFATNIISIPITTVLFTNISELCSQKKLDEVRNVTEKAVISVLLICIPIAVITIFCSNNIVSFVYGYGKFSQDAIMLTSTVLSGYGLSIAFYVLKDVINRIAYALMQTKLPMIIGIFSVIIHIAIALILSPYIGVMSIVWATIASVGFTAISTLYVLSKKHLKCNFKAYTSSILKITLAAIATISVLFVCTKYFDIGLGTNKLADLSEFVVFTVIGFISYFGLLLMFKEPLIHELYYKMIKKIRRNS